MGKRDERDDRMAQELRAAAARLDPVPAAVREAALAAYGWRRLDPALAELTLAELTFDSSESSDERVLAGVRSSGGPRLVTFTAPEVTVEVEVTEQGRTRRLLGQLVPPAPARVSVSHPGGTLVTDADEFGRFGVDEVAAGPVRVRCDLAAGGTVETDWAVL